MPLFKIEKRPGRSQDSTVAKKSKTANKAVSTVHSASNLLSRIAEIRMAVERNLGQYKDEYSVIYTVEELEEYIDASLENDVISIDTETTGLDPISDKIVGLCLYTPNQKPAYVPINHISYKTGVRISTQLTEKQVHDVVQKLVDERIKDIIMFNAKFDIRVMRNQLGLKDIYCTWDGYLAARLLNENEPTSGLKALHKKYVLDGKGDAFSFDALFKNISFDKIPIEVGYLYAAHDAIITYEYYLYQRKYLRLDSEREDIRNIAWVFHNIEMPCIAVVADMEDIGVDFDLAYAEKLSEKYHKLLEEKEKAFHEACKMYDKQIEGYKKIHKANVKIDTPINIGSPTQIAILLYDIIGVKSVDKKSPRGTGEDILKQMDLPLCKTILEYREITKLLGTYIDKLPECVNKDGRIHCSFNQYGAATGRFSSSDPNLQNIPSHNKDIRKMFKATNAEFRVDVEADSIQVDMWDEVMTELGWKCANNIVVGDAIEVEADGKFDLETVVKIDKSENTIRFIF